MANSDSSENSPAAVTRRLLEEAARSYMDGDYEAAAAAWTRVLDVDPDNPRAREGLKKVSMLAPEPGGDEGAASPVLAEIEQHLEQRRFDAAAQICREQLQAAGPALSAALRKLLDRAERARTVEPEIQHAMASARRSLQEGDLRAAIPQLKQVLSLDRDHPVARRLMDGIRERARRKAGGDVTAADEGSLPASGRPGSDAPDRFLSEESLNLETDITEEPPAPAGHGLPSSPVVSGEETVPEIELEMLPLEGEEPAGPAMEAGETPGMETEPDSGEESDDVVGEMPEPIQLVSEPQAQGHRFAQSAPGAESPFAGAEGEDAAPDARPEAPAPDRPGAPAERRTSAASGEPSIQLQEESGEGRRTSAPEPPPVERDLILPPAAPRRSRRRLPALAAGLLLVVAVGGAAWYLDWIPGLAATPRPLEVSRPAPAVPQEEASAPAASAPAAPSPAPRPAQPSPRAAAPKPDPKAALSLFESGQDLYEAGRFEESAAAFRQAVLLDPVNPDIASWQAKVERRLQERQRMEAENASAVAAFQEKDFETALRKFYRLQEKTPAGSYDRAITNSWYNWGLQLLAAGNLREADRKMDEVLSMGADQEATAVKKLIEEYRNRAKDRIFYLRVEALRYRPLDA